MQNQFFNHRSNDGFTLLEILVVVAIIGVLSAITAPSWLSFLDVCRLNNAQDQVYRAMRDAQVNARREKIAWQAGFRERTLNGKSVVQWAVYPASLSPEAASWQNLEPNIHLDNETNLSPAYGVRRVMFNYRGCPVYEEWNECTHTSIQVQGRLTLASQNGGKAKRCVIVSTLLGELRREKEQPTPDSKGKYCY